MDRRSRSPGVLSLWRCSNEAWTCSLHLSICVRTSCGSADDHAHRARRAEIVEDACRQRRALRWRNRSARTLAFFSSRGLRGTCGAAFPDRDDLKLIERLDRALRAGVEAADRFDGVAHELDANRRVLARGKHIEDASAQRELAVLVHRILTFVAALDEDARQGRAARFRCRAEIDRRRQHRLRRRQPRRQRLRRGDDDARGRRARRRGGHGRVPTRHGNGAPDRDRDRPETTETAARRAPRRRRTVLRAPRERSARRSSPTRARHRSARTKSTTASRALCAAAATASAFAGGVSPEYARPRPARPALRDCAVEESAD